MTTRSTARPTAGASPTPDRTTMTDYRAYERLIDAIDEGRITLDPTTHEYRDTRRRCPITNVDRLVYELVDAGRLHLLHNGTILMLQAGRQWRNRPRQGSGRKPVAAVEFQSAVEAVA